MNNLFRKIDWTTINRYSRDEQVDTDSAFRIYKSMPDRATLQVRGPLRKSNGHPGCFGIIASAQLNIEELTALRDGVNECLEALS